MTKAFISYSTADEVLARQIYGALTQVGVTTFLASISIDGGAKWSEEVFRNLREASYVFFIASSDACKSHAVQQELGAALAQGKVVLPILTDITPAELPAWTKDHQAINLNDTPERLNQVIHQLGEQVRSDRFWNGVVVGGLVVGLAALAASR